MDKDLVLTQIFEVMAEKANRDKGVGKFIQQGAEYFVCAVAAMQREPLAEDADTLKKGVMYPYAEDKFKPFDGTDLNRFKPEVALEYDYIPLNDYKRDNLIFLPVEKPPVGDPGFWLLEMDREAELFRYIKTIPFGSTRFLKEANMIAYTIPSCIGTVLAKHKLKLSDVGGCLMVSKLSQHLSIGLTGDTAFMYAAMGGIPVSCKAYKNILVKDTVYSCDGLEEFEILGSTGTAKGSRYTAIIKRKVSDMKLGSPVQDKKEAIARNMAASELVTTASPTDAEINKAVNAPVVQAAEQPAGLRSQLAACKDTPAASLGDSIPVEEYQKQEELKVEEETTNPQLVPEDIDKSVTSEVPDAAGSITTAPAVEKPKAKRRTKQATATGGFDFESVIDYLGSPVQAVGASDLETALAEIRSLRDVQINAARRAANITSEICKASASGLQTLAELQAILKK